MISTSAARLGVDRDAPVGFSAIRLSFELETDADDEQLATLKKLTERYCVVYQTLAGEAGADHEHHRGLTGAAGKPTVTVRPPPGRACAARCAS